MRQRMLKEYWAQYSFNILCPNYSEILIPSQMKVCWNRTVINVSCLKTNRGTGPFPLPCHYHGVVPEAPTQVYNVRQEYLVQPLS
jgi:hypothetical protein